MKHARSRERPIIFCMLLQDVIATPFYADQRYREKRKLFPQIIVLQNLAARRLLKFENFTRNQLTHDTRVNFSLLRKSCAHQIE